MIPVFSKNVDYSVMNKYILSSVGLWFAMLLTDFTMFKNER
jgi:hypothetical protein